MIVNCLIKRVEVSRGYKLKVEFNINFEQFMVGLDKVAYIAKTPSSAFYPEISCNKIRNRILYDKLIFSLNIYGFKITLIHPSSLLSKIEYPLLPSSRLSLCVIISVASNSPFFISSRIGLI